jgi:ABC-type branched-subunit amino acid transport system ATPase component
VKRTILDIQDIQKSFAINYTGRGRAFKKEYRNVINGLSMKLQDGKVSALIGGNGAGKTTLFNLISGLLRPDSGSITFDNASSKIECTQCSPWKISGAGVGRMFQGTRIFGELSVMDHLMLQVTTAGLEVPGINIVKARKHKEVIRNLRFQINEDLQGIGGLEEILKHIDKPAASLSFAQQRMLSLAGLLIGDYKLLLLDEPSSGMSPDSYDTLYAIINRMKGMGRSVFLIEHNMAFIRNVVDHCHYMEEGKLRYSGSPEEVLAKEEVQQSYLM